MFKKLVTSIFMLLLITGLCGCSVSYRNPDTMKKDSASSAPQKATTEITATTTEQVVELPANYHEDATKGINDIFGDIEDLSSFKIEKIEANEDTEATNRCDLTLNLVWNINFEPAVAKSIAQKRCNTISVKVAEQLPYVSKLHINITVPSLDNATVTANYKQHGSTLSMVETKFDEKFD